MQYNTKENKMKQFGKVYIVENVHDYLSMMNNDFESIVKNKDSITYETEDRTYICPNELTSIGSAQDLWDRSDIIDEWKDIQIELSHEISKLVEEKLNRIDSVIKSVCLSPEQCEPQSTAISAIIQINEHDSFQRGKKYPALVEKRNSRILRCLVMSDDFELYIFSIYNSETNQKTPPIYLDGNPIGIVVRWDNNAVEK